MNCTPTTDIRVVMLPLSFSFAAHVALKLDLYFSVYFKMVGGISEGLGVFWHRAPDKFGSEGILEGIN